VTAHVDPRGTVVVAFRDRRAATAAERRLRQTGARGESVRFDGRSADPADTARHAAAGQAAARWALATTAVTLLVTLAVAVNGTIASSPLMAVGVTTALTGAPFAGALAGFTIATMRWSGGAVEVHADRRTRPGTIYLAVRTDDPAATRSVLLGNS
jgi:hypothetical protein